MYSGTTLRHNSGNMIGAHQKIDRVAHKLVKKILPPTIDFPSSREILYFEGVNGPDGIKRKSPSKDEPWHYFDPLDPSDIELITIIDNHLHNLTKALTSGNNERTAFEAAWLAHSIVDGLTPAHHYPLEEKIEELWGYPKEERITIRQKALIKGTDKRDSFIKNWQYWGAKGIFMSHFLFEMGIATTIAPMKFTNMPPPNQNERIIVKKEGIAPLFRETALYILSLGMYEAFFKKGWTRQLARQTREELAPLIVKVVALSWYLAAEQASEARQKTLNKKKS